MELWRIYRWFRWCIFLRNKGAEEQQSLGRKVKKCTPSLEKVRIKISPFGSLHQIQVDLFPQSVKVWNFFVKCWSLLILDSLKAGATFLCWHQRVCCFPWGTWVNIFHPACGQMGVSKNRGTPKSSILLGFSIINHPFWGIPNFGNTQMAPAPSPARFYSPSCGACKKFAPSFESAARKGSSNFTFARMAPGPGFRWSQRWWWWWLVLLAGIGSMFLLGVFWGRRVEGNDETAWKHHIATAEWTENVLFVAV